MISKDDDLYDDKGDESYDPAEDDDANDITEVHDNEDAPPTDPDNKYIIKEDVNPYPGIPAIIVYGNGKYAKAIPSGVYHDANDAYNILLDDATSTGVHILHIPGAEEIQIPGLITENTDNTAVPNNVGLVNHNKTPDQNTAEQAATDKTDLSDDDRPPSTA